MKITEINQALTTDQRVEIANQIAIRGKVGMTSVYRWLNGEAKPLHLYRELIQKIIEDVTGKKLQSDINWN